VIDRSQAFEDLGVLTFVLHVSNNTCKVRVTCLFQNGIDLVLARADDSDMGPMFQKGQSCAIADTR
jgi:hypothetical protein